MLNAVKHLAGGKAGFSTLEQILPCGQNDSRSGFGMVTFGKPRIAGITVDFGVKSRWSPHYDLVIALHES